MTRITFFGGNEGIGGNKILVEAGDARFFLDHGQSFSYGDQFFTGWLKSRDSRTGLKDHFRLGLLPFIPGLYSSDKLSPTGHPYEEPEFDGIFISHVHYDHLAHLNFVDETIPVHIGETTKKMLDSWEATGSMIKFGDHPYQTFKTGDVVPVHGVDVEPVHVDHSTPAAYGMIVHAPDGAIVYTGDLRLHGPMAQMTLEFIERAKEARPVALICEGTRVAPAETRKNFTEQEVLEEAIKLVKEEEKLVVVSFYGRDVDRIKTYHEVARATGRKFAVSDRVAHLLQELVPDPGIMVPDPFTDPDLLVYGRQLTRSAKWQKDIASKVSMVNAEYIHDNQASIIIHVDFHHFNELIDIDPDPGSLFINSVSEPFTEDDIADEVKDNWLKHFGMKRVQLHASGHCSMEEIFQIVEEIEPKTVFPVHTEHPELFADHVSCRVVVPGARGSSFDV